jgi:hypothetical protein
MLHHVGRPKSYHFASVWGGLRGGLYDLKTMTQLISGKIYRVEPSPEPNQDANFSYVRHASTNFFNSTTVRL